ncbi:M1 family metallopeptidase [Mucilaginibacter sp.]|uniref:M1 family metallopeptidase n=1 Tax=Mucilaginibacter sp. TaxID=1882438 RepID=UPI003D0DA04E
MKPISSFITALILLAGANSYAQTTLPIPVNLQATYTKGTRTINGAPGKNYWQNYADYTINVNFDPQSLLLQGTVSVDYTNNSPDDLSEIDFKLYPNIYKKGSVRNMPVLPADITDGVQIKKMSINTQDQDASAWTIDGTNMTVKLSSPLASKQKIHFDITYAYTINKISHIRTGQVDPSSFFIAYFFPRIAVYDDIDGWNQNHYRGSEEFYNDFCHFNLAVTVPGNYKVWSTGTLKNTSEVYSPQIVQRINAAALSDKVTDIIAESDIKAGNITPNNPTNTWKFEADTVTDMAFATSDHYIWKASSLVVDPKTGRRTRVDAVFNPQHKTYFNVINYARKTVEAMSYQFPKWPYPYPHETVFDGLDQMEYPMMVNDNPVEKSDDDIELTDHEIFHTMFPFYMGVNETKYGWMDEGWATIGEWVISPIIDPSVKDTFGVEEYATSAGKEEDQPITALTTQLAGISFFTDSYPKPGMGYLYVRDMLGDELFTKALHNYIAQWHGKHPMPYDFFNCMNAGAGINMNWFWKSWFFDNGIPDLGITKVSNVKNQYTIVITSEGTKPVPIDLIITYKDGSTQTYHQSVACWAKGNKTFTVNLTAKKKITKLVLGGTYDPDSHKEDNVWEAK